MSQTLQRDEQALDQSLKALLNAHGYAQVLNHLVQVARHERQPMPSASYLMTLTPEERGPFLQAAVDDALPLYLADLAKPEAERELTVDLETGDFYETADTSHILCDERGVAWIDDSNVKVVEVTLDHVQGLSPENIHAEYPPLSLAQIYAAVAYYYDNKPEIDTLMQEGQTRYEAEYTKSEQQIWRDQMRVHAAIRQSALQVAHLQKDVGLKSYAVGPAAQ